MTRGISIAAAVLAFLTLACSAVPIQAESNAHNHSEEYEEENDYENEQKDDAYAQTEEKEENEIKNGKNEIKVEIKKEETEDESEETTEEESVPSPGIYTVPSGWSEDKSLSTEECTVYCQDIYADAEMTSTISCSYLETNYSTQEYEQLREMLTNNLLYDNVNAQISTSAIYTLARDYFYIILVDDASEAYRVIYNYVVGDYCCFCVKVKEYRSEAEKASANGGMTPSEAGQNIAENFVWNTDP